MNADATNRLVIVPDWVSEIADRYAEETAAGCPVSVAIERAVMEALSAEPDEDVRALPPEPPVGGVVQFIEGRYAGREARRLLSGAWDIDGGVGSGWGWQWLLSLAGPAGVRVVKNGER